MSNILDRESGNPRIQCDRCGQWSRLNKADGEQNHFPGYIEDAEGNYVEIYWDACLRCVEALDAMKKDLTLAYEAGRSHPHDTTA